MNNQASHTSHSHTCGDNCDKNHMQFRGSPAQCVAVPSHESSGVTTVNENKLNDASSDDEPAHAHAHGCHSHGAPHIDTQASCLSRLLRCAMKDTNEGHVHGHEETEATRCTSPSGKALLNGGLPLLYVGLVAVHFVQQWVSSDTIGYDFLNIVLLLAQFFNALVESGTHTLGFKALISGKETFDCQHMGYKLTFLIFILLGVALNEALFTVNRLIVGEQSVISSVALGVFYFLLSLPEGFDVFAHSHDGSNKFRAGISCLLRACLTPLAVIASFAELSEKNLRLEFPNFTDPGANPVLSNVTATDLPRLTTSPALPANVSFFKGFADNIILLEGICPEGQGLGCYLLGSYTAIINTVAFLIYYTHLIPKMLESIVSFCVDHFQDIKDKWQTHKLLVSAVSSVGFIVILASILSPLHAGVGLAELFGKLGLGADWDSPVQALVYLSLLPQYTLFYAAHIVMEMFELMLKNLPEKDGESNVVANLASESCDSIHQQENGAEAGKDVLGDGTEETPLNPGDAVAGYQTVVAAGADAHPAEKNSDEADVVAPRFCCRMM